MKKITPKHIIVERKLSQRKITCRVKSAGPTEDYNTDRTYQAETENSNAYKSLYFWGIELHLHMERG